MGGKIDAPNQGTALVVMIKSKVSPQTINSSAPKHLTAVNPIQHGSDAIQRVLIVEDIPFNQEIHQKLLNKCNVQEIVIANNGQEALDIDTMKKPQYFDLILMDIDMPVLDGKTTTKKIRQFERERGWIPTSIVFLTAYSEAKTQSKLLNPNGEYRANGFLSKLVSLEAIQRTLREKLMYGDQNGPQ